MSRYKSMLGKMMEYQVSGKYQTENGMLVDAGEDILVFHHHNRYHYIPLKHLHFMKAALDTQENLGDPEENPIEKATEDSISYRKTLFLARGLFLEMHVTGIHSLNGYLTSVMNDYLVFYSPVFHTVYVSLEHLKTLTPYPLQSVPYCAGKEHFSLKPTGLTLARTFEQQLKKMEGSIAVLDLGDAADKSGLVQSVEDGMLSLVSAGGDVTLWNIQHIKSAHLP